MHIQCDEELMKRFDLAKEKQDSVSADRYSTILGSWHASIIKILGSQFLLYVHTKSLYSTLDLMDFENTPLVSQTVNNLRGKIIEMLSEHYYLSDFQENGLVQPFKNVTFGPIDNKRMLQISQGIAVTYQKRFLRARQESPHGEVRLWELEDDVNGLPRRNLGGASPAEILCQLIWSGLN